MIKASGFRTVAVHAVAFTPPSASQFAPASILSSVMGAGPHSNLFNGDISVFPLPAEIPAEVPRVQLKSGDDQWTLIAAPARISVTWAAQTSTQDVPADAIDTCATILVKYFNGRADVEFNRLALVLQRAHAASNPAQELIDRFCSLAVSNPQSPSSPLRHSLGFELHNLKKYVADDFKINSWARCKTGQYKDDETVSIVSFEQDLNIAEDAEIAFEPKAISKYFKMAERKANKIHALYFPE